MQKIKKMLFFTLLLCLLITLTRWFYYALTSSKNEVTHTLGCSNTKYDIQKMFNGSIHKGLVHIAELAMLCNLVYRHEGTKNQDEFGQWCRSPILPIKANTEDTSKNILKSFYYEIWELETTPQKKNIAIVFRGSTASWDDWRTNFRWFRIFDNKTYDHYDQLNEISKDLIKTIQNHPNNQGKELTFIATGHSLGGGLAQFLAYAVPEVELVLAFNSSPVTGYFDLEKSRRIANSKNLHVYRIHESGEALSYVRDAMMLLYPLSLFSTKDPAMVKIRFSFYTGRNLVFQHGIEEIAKNLISLKETKIN